ncbi:hypothetical protein HDU97_006059 [Phlyctochytrium planicorne]|nr:hypothetical protein HDU97_006059 [Phlyctochytrium planicorne]
MERTRADFGNGESLDMELAEEEGELCGDDTVNDLRFSMLAGFARPVSLKVTICSSSLNPALFDDFLVAVEFDFVKLASDPMPTAMDVLEIFAVRLYADVFSDFGSWTELPREARREEP